MVDYFGPDGNDRMRTLGGSLGLERPVAASASPELFIVGAPRSGTTLVYKALALHPGVTYTSNWLRRRPGWRWLTALNRIPRSATGLRRRYWFGAESNAYRYGSQRSLAERMFPNPVEGGPVFEAAGLRADSTGVTPEQAQSLQEAFAAMRRFGAATTVVSKRIQNNRVLPVLAGVFPEARFVNIVRDGRAVAYSLSRVNWWDEAEIWWSDMTPEQWRAAGRDEWELPARVWVEEVRVVREALARIDPSRTLEVSYEALVASPHEILARMADFAGLPASNEWQEALRDVKFSSQNEVWRSALDAAAQQRIAAVQAEELRRHGYV
jgi:hypothetical protein